jgi:hypothetical protein
MSEFDVAPGPLALFRKVPAKVRWYTYSVLASVLAIEGVLDADGLGLIPERTESVVIGLASLFGFVLAAANTEKPA